MTDRMVFGIATSVVHKKWNGRIYAYEPYVREMNLWISNFDRIIIAAPIIEEEPEKNQIEYLHENLSSIKLPNIGGKTLYSKVESIVFLPYILLILFRMIRILNHLHIRLPGNVGFFALLLCPFFGTPKTAKYASQWKNYEGEPFTNRVQKFLVSRPLWFRNGRVLVYGNGSNNSRSNVIPFFTASYYQKEIDKAKDSIKSKFLNKDGVVNIAFIGRMSANKGGIIALEAIKKLGEEKHNVFLHLVGEGEESPLLKKRVKSLGVDSIVKFYGNLDKKGVADILAKSHFILLTSKTEGWPKVIAEGMVWGAVPIATAISCVPWMLGNGERGRLIERNPESVVNALEYYINNPDEYRSALLKAHKWASQFTLERFNDAIKDFSY